MLSAEGQNLLLLGSTSTCVLPTVDLQRAARLGLQIQSYCERQWSIGCEVIDIILGAHDSGLIIVRLPTARDGTTPFPFRRRRIEDLASGQITTEEARIIVRLQTTGETGRGP